MGLGFWVWSLDSGCGVFGVWVWGKESQGFGFRFQVSCSGSGKDLSEDELADRRRAPQVVQHHLTHARHSVSSSHTRVVFADYHLTRARATQVPHRTHLSCSQIWCALICADLVFQ